MRLHVRQQHAQTVAPDFRLFRTCEEVLGRLQQQQKSGAVLLPLAQPTAQEFIAAVFDQSEARVGDVDLVLSDLVHHDEVPLSPMRDRRQRSLVAQRFVRHLHRERAQADRFRRLRDAGQRHTLTRNAALVPHELGIERPAVEAADHAQAGRTAIHQIHLPEEREICS